MDGDNAGERKKGEIEKVKITVRCGKKRWQRGMDCGTLADGSVANVNRYCIAGGRGNAISSCS